MQLTPSKAKTPIPTLATCALDMVENGEHRHQRNWIILSSKLAEGWIHSFEVPRLGFSNMGVDGVVMKQDVLNSQRSVSCCMWAIVWCENHDTRGAHWLLMTSTSGRISNPKTAWEKHLWDHHSYNWWWLIRCWKLDLKQNMDHFCTAYGKPIVTKATILFKHIFTHK